jgi:hypothetical protein
MKNFKQKWSVVFESFLEDTLEKFSKETNEVMERFSVDCHPWNGSIFLAFLTSDEASESPFLLEPAEIAAWKYYDFASARSSTHPEIAKEMHDIYYASEDKELSAKNFFVACADVVAKKSIQNMLAKFKLSSTFQITISHPDTGTEFYQTNS